MTKTTYTNRIAAAGKKLADMHNKGEKVTYTTAWNVVFTNVFNGNNYAKVDGVYRYMPDTIVEVMRYARGLV